MEDGQLLDAVSACFGVLRGCIADAAHGDGQEPQVGIAKSAICSTFGLAHPVAVEYYASIYPSFTIREELLHAFEGQINEFEVGVITYGRKRVYNYLPMDHPITFDS